MSNNADRYVTKGAKKRRSELMRQWIKAPCPVCGARLVFPGITRKAKANGIADCNTCGALLLVKRGKATDFHRKLHKETGGVWPADGSGTSYVDF